MSTPPPPPPGFPTPPPGYPPTGPAGYGAYPAAPQGNSGMAIAGFVLALVGLVPCFWFWFLQIPGYLAVIFSVLGMKATAGNAKKGRGLAIAGLVVGIVAVVAALALTAFVYTSDDCVVDGLSFECDFDSL